MKSILYASYTNDQCLGHSQKKARMFEPFFVNAVIHGDYAVYVVKMSVCEPDFWVSFLTLPMVDRVGFE